MTENALAKVLRLAAARQVRAYARVERGRTERVRGYQQQFAIPGTPVRSGWIPQDRWKSGQETWREHGEALRRLARSLAVHNANSDVARAVDRAADALIIGQPSPRIAQTHLGDAVWWLRTTGQNQAARQVEAIQDELARRIDDMPAREESLPEFNERMDRESAAHGEWLADYHARRDREVAEGARRYRAG